jgi:hypothetical protein
MLRFQIKAGAGPRQLAMHPRGDLAYFINELNSTVKVLQFNSASGSLQEIQTIETLSYEVDSANICAEMQSPRPVIFFMHPTVGMTVSWSMPSTRWMVNYLVSGMKAYSVLNTYNSTHSLFTCFVLPGLP